MVKGLNLIGTAAVLIALNVLVMLALDTAFIEVSLLVGIAAIVVVRLFTSPSNFAKANRVGPTNKLETVQLGEQKTYIHPKVIVNTCFLYTAVFFVVVMVAYYDYFTA
ncbi:hypothetical protein [Jeotgalibacillus marinus]|uniref:DUF3899 domain-containing protein n=1 Tax=Jeotgalibacillus marinus TaxID=86667 RepID=A0ABV3Q796_9BACL